MGYLEFILAYAGPFIALAILMLGWFFLAWKLEARFPAFYKFTAAAYERLPQIGFVLLLVVIVYFFFTESTYYNW